MWIKPTDNSVQLWASLSFKAGKRRCRWLLQRTWYRSRCRALPTDHPQYPFPSNAAIASLDDRTVLTTIITWNTQCPLGKLQRDRGISLFPPCHPSAPARCQLYFKHHNRLWNITRSNRNLHVIFLSAICPSENTVTERFGSQWNDNYGEKTSNRFFICDHKGGAVCPLIMQRTSAEAASQSSSARQRQLGECSLVLQRLTSAGPNNFRLLIWCFHQTLAMEHRGPLDSPGFNL